MPSLHHKHHAIYIDMLGVPSLHHEHHAIYIDMLGVPSLYHKHHVVLFIITKYLNSIKNEVAS